MSPSGARFLEPFCKKLKKLNAGYAFLGSCDLFLYSNRHTLEDYEMDPLPEALCEENRVPITYQYADIDAGGRLACFDLAHGVFEVRFTKGLRERLISDSSD